VGLDVPARLHDRRQAVTHATGVDYGVPTPACEPGEHIPIDTPYLATRYCPVCEPARDPCDEVLEVSYCSVHMPDVGGESDRLVSAWAYLSGGAEAGGEDNQRWCDVIHGGHRP